MKYMIGLLVLCFAQHLIADQQPVEELRKFLAETETLKADFKQVSLNPNGQVDQKSSGQFYLSRPGYFRWNYAEPFEQEIVSAQGKIWFYDADLEQVTIKKLDDSIGSTPALLLSGDVALDKKFVLEKQGEDEGLQWVKLSPKNQQSEFNYILIGLDKGQLGGMEISDSFGQLTRIYFSNLKQNPTLANDIFKFEAPKGVDVFEK